MMRNPAERLSSDQQALFGDAYGWHKRWYELTFGANSAVKSAMPACCPPIKWRKVAVVCPASSLNTILSARSGSM